jgi:hypothetical protein
MERDQERKDNSRNIALERTLRIQGHLIPQLCAAGKFAKD